MAQNETGSNIAIRDSTVLADYKPRGIIEIAQSSAIMQRLIAAVMKPDVHYGIIPGTKKRTLFKPGSEKILSTFMISVDIEAEDLSTEDCVRYRVKAVGRTPDGTIVGYGIGECSTAEEKYLWRAPVCHEEYVATDPMRRREKWFKGYQGKPAEKKEQIRTNPADLANTVLKMAKKRAQIDLTLTATAASDVFEQDLEDLADVIDITEYQKGGKPEVKQPQSAHAGEQSDGAPPDKDPAAKITGGGANYLKNQLDAKKIPHADFCAHMKIAAIGDITNENFNAACGVIKKWEAQP